MPWATSTTKVPVTYGEASPPIRDEMKRSANSSHSGPWPMVPWKATSRPAPQASHRMHATISTERARRISVACW